MSMETRRTTRRKVKLEHGKFLVSEDRLSNLPEPLVHDIISRLPSKSVAIMSTLSKKWEYLLKTYPGIIFDEKEFEFKSDRKNDGRLCQFMRKYSFQTPTPIQKIRIGTTLLRHSKIINQVDRFIDLSIPTEIRELDLKFRHSHRVLPTRCRCYTLPSKIISLGLHLTIMELEGCRFGNLDVVNVPLLKVISLTYVHLSDDTFFKLITACTSLESLVLQYCYGLRRLKVINHSLRRLIVNHCRYLEIFYIDCPFLQYLECKAREIYEVGGNLQLSNCFTSCGSLKAITFLRVDLKAEALKHIISNSPHISSLTMRSCEIEGTMKVYPQELKYLELEDTYFPQLFEGFSTIESFSFGKNVFKKWSQQENISSDYEILCSMIVNFVHLKSLSLRGAILPSNESLEFVISNCPLLQSLCLVNCRDVKHLRIRSQALKKLSITSSADIQADCEIWAPNLISFKFEGPLIQFIGLVFSGELVAEMQFRECYESSSPLSASKLVYYVRMFHEARKLTLGNHFTECVLTLDHTTMPSLYCHGQLRASISVGKMRYKEFLLEMLRMSVCHTSLSLNFELGGFPLSGDSSAVLDLKFYDCCQQGDMLVHVDDHDCIQDHLYEVNVQIMNAPARMVELLKFILSKAIYLKKLKVLINCQLPAKIRQATISKITTMKIASQNCEVILC